MNSNFEMEQMSTADGDGARLYEYQQGRRFFVQVAGGMEDLAIAELTELGAVDAAAAYRGVYCTADNESLYRINYCSRLISHVLAPLFSFKCHSTKYLYNMARELRWHDFMDVDMTFALDAAVSHSKIHHSRYAMQVLKDAICDHFRDRNGKRPSVDRHEADIRFHLHIDHNRATISLDTSGESLHRRAYRTESVEAPMQETLAAAIVRLSGWKGERALRDPMCGAGTLLAEAWMHATHLPAAFKRAHFGFERLPDFEAEKWKQVRAAADGAIVKEVDSFDVAGSDVNPAAVRAAQNNLANLPNGGRVAVTHQNIMDLPGYTDTTLLINPPYGVRIGERQAAEDLLREVGNFLKRRCTGCEAYIYVGDRKLLGAVGLRPSWKQALVNGSLDGRLAKFELY